MKFSSVGIGGGIDGIQHLYLQDSSFGHSVHGIVGGWLQTGLQVKFQDRAGGNADGRNGWTLRISDTREQADGAKKRNQGTMHGLGLSCSENKGDDNFKFARRVGQREKQQAVANRSTGITNRRPI